LIAGSRGFNWLIFGLIVVILTACVPTEPQVVYITATPGAPLQPNFDAPLSPTSAPPPTAISVAIDGMPPNVTTDNAASSPSTYTVESGDTLFAIAQRFDTTVDTLTELNNMDNADLITVGQTLELPAISTIQAPLAVLLSDASFVRGPISPVDVNAAIASRNGYLASARFEVDERTADGSTVKLSLTGAEVIARVSRETSIDPRILLAFLQYRVGWLDTLVPTETDYPLISRELSAGVNRSGLYRQLSWAANQLNRAYYRRLFGPSLTALEFDDGTRVGLDASLNAATVAIYSALQIGQTVETWQRDISSAGLMAMYAQLFGSPDTTIAAVSLPQQPVMELPFAIGETWLFTGGPHGGWGSGSAWAALDFAPPDERPVETTLCFTSVFAARAVADGVVSRVERGTVILDLDGDRDERTGWTVLYLHLAERGRILEGTRVSTGDVIGFPSCEGGFSSATHLHIARRYNGFWIPADCQGCALERPFLMSGWQARGLAGQEYQGDLVRGSITRTAEQTRLDPINRISR
jgi:murein DD-endopeptidase MepM/ murein hydrolase activator NlpD